MGMKNKYIFPSLSASPDCMRQLTNIFTLFWAVALNDRPQFKCEKKFENILSQTLLCKKNFSRQKTDLVFHTFPDIKAYTGLQLLSVCVALNLYL